MTTNSKEDSLVPIYSIKTGKVELVEKIKKTDEEWKNILSKESYNVARQKGTELAFTGKYHDCHEDGIYECVCCGTDLFNSNSKFDSGTGWPSFWQPIADGNIKEHKDRSYGMIRTESLCARCDAHLGHVFDDGPKTNRIEILYEFRIPQISQKINLKICCRYLFELNQKLKNNFFYCSNALIDLIKLVVE